MRWFLLHYPQTVSSRNEFIGACAGYISWLTLEKPIILPTIMKVYKGDKCNDFFVYCSMLYCCHAMTAWRNMCCLVTAGKHINNIQATARQPPITIVEGLLEAVFSVGSALKQEPQSSWVQCSAFQFSWVKWSEVKWSSWLKSERVQLWNIHQTPTMWEQEAEESPLLETVAGEWLLKTQMVGKRLSRCCGDL
jgi:hypothetical protein